jgi:hypothetical protein
MAIGSTLEKLVLSNDADYRRAVVGYGGVFNIFVDTNTSFVLTELEVLPFQYRVDSNLAAKPVFEVVDNTVSIPATYDEFFADIIAGGEYQIRIVVDGQTVHNINYRPSITYTPEFDMPVDPGIYRGAKIEAAKYDLFLVAFKRIEIYFLKVSSEIVTSVQQYNDPTLGYSGGFSQPLGFSNTTNFFTVVNVLDNTIFYVPPATDALQQGFLGVGIGTDELLYPAENVIPNNIVAQINSVNPDDIGKYVSTLPVLNLEYVKIKKIPVSKQQALPQFKE